MKKEAFIVLALVMFIFFFSWIFSDQIVTGTTSAASVTGAVAKGCPCNAKLQMSCQDNCFKSYSGLKQACASSSVETARACHDRAVRAYQTCLTACR